MVDLQQASGTNINLQVSDIFAKASSPQPTLLPLVSMSAANNKYAQLLSEFLELT